MRHMTALVLTLLCGATAWYLWVGFNIPDVAKWDGLPKLLQGTWAWDLRYALIPAYAVAMLWIFEKAGAVLAPK